MVPEGQPRVCVPGGYSHTVPIITSPNYPPLCVAVSPPAARALLPLPPPARRCGSATGWNHPHTGEQRGGAETPGELSSPASPAAPLGRGPRLRPCAPGPVAGRVRCQGRAQQGGAGPAGWLARVGARLALRQDVRGIGAGRARGAGAWLPPLPDQLDRLRRGRSVAGPLTPPPPHGHIITPGHSAVPSLFPIPCFIFVGHSS